MFERRGLLTSAAPSPEELAEILARSTVARKRAFDLLRQYNNALSFVSYGKDGLQSLHLENAAAAPPIIICQTLPMLVLFPRRISIATFRAHVHVRSWRCRGAALEKNLGMQVWIA